MLPTEVMINKINLCCVGFFRLFGEAFILKSQAYVLYLLSQLCHVSTIETFNIQYDACGVCFGRQLTVSVVHYLTLRSLIVLKLGANLNESAHGSVLFLWK